MMSEQGEEDMKEVVTRSWRAFWPLSGICFYSERDEAFEDFEERSDMI